MISINTNYGGIFAAKASSQSQATVDSAMEKLSSGKRINFAKDDAAGQAIATRLNAEVDGLAMASRNAADAQSMLDTAEGGMQETHTILLRMRELAVQSANGTLTDNDRVHSNAEFKQLQAEIDRISVNTQWAGQNLLTGVSLSFQVGEGAGQKIDVTIGDIDTFQPSNTSGATVFYGVTGTSTSTTASASAAGYALSADATTAAVVTTASAHGFVTGDIVHAGLDASETGAFGLANGAGYTVTKISDTTFSLTNYDANGVGTAVINDGTGEAVNSHAITFTKLDKTGVDTASNAQTAISAVDYAIAYVSKERGALGAVSNRLTSTMNNLDQISINLSASKGRIEDADFAAETGNLAKGQILQQAATAMLAQANASKQQVLTLIR
jgi:flagellin